MNVIRNFFSIKREGGEKNPEKFCLKLEKKKKKKYSQHNFC